MPKKFFSSTRQMADIDVELFKERCEYRNNRRSLVVVANDGRYFDFYSVASFVTANR